MNALWELMDNGLTLDVIVVGDVVPHVVEDARHLPVQVELRSVKLVHRLDGEVVEDVPLHVRHSLQRQKKY